MGKARLFAVFTDTTGPEDTGCEVVLYGPGPLPPGTYRSEAPCSTFGDDGMLWTDRGEPVAGPFYRAGDVASWLLSLGYSVKWLLG